MVEVGEFGLDLLREVLKHGNRRVEKAVARIAAFNNELKKKMDENIKLQERGGSLNKVLRHAAKGVEMGRMSANVFLFGECITYQLTLQLPVFQYEVSIEISSIHT